MVKAAEIGRAHHALIQPYKRTAEQFRFRTDIDLLHQRMAQLSHFSVHIFLGNGLFGAVVINDQARAGTALLCNLAQRCVAVSVLQKHFHRRPQDRVLFIVGQARVLHFSSRVILHRT